MLKNQLGPAFKRTSLMKYLDELLVRDLQEIADPNLAQKLASTLGAYLIGCHAVHSIKNF